MSFGSNDFGDDFFMLPSQRKKMMNQNSSGASKKVKKRPSKQPKKTVDQILNEDDDSLFNDGFQLDSDDISPNSAAKKSSPIKEDTKKNSPNKKNINLETNSRNTIDRIESSLKEYITNAINAVRQNFIDELKIMINDSMNEQSMIDQFLFSLPAEIEETALKEINTAKEEYIDKTTSITNTISSFFNTIETVVPIRSTNLPQVSLEKLADDIYIYKTSLDDKYILPIRDLQNQNKLYASALSQNSINQESKRIQSPKMTLEVELEGYLKKIEVEEEAIKYKIKVIQQRKNEWQEAQIDPNRNKLSDPEILLSKFSELSRKITQSKYGGAVYNLKTLSENIQSSLTNTKQIRKQFEVELTFLISKINMSQNRKNKKISRSKSKGDDVFVNEYANDVKRQLDSMKRKRAIQERFFKDTS